MVLVDYHTMVLQSFLTVLLPYLSVLCTSGTPKSRTTATPDPQIACGSPFRGWRDCVSPLGCRVLSAAILCMIPGRVRMVHLPWDCGFWGMCCTFCPGRLIAISPKVWPTWHVLVQSTKGACSHPQSWETHPRAAEGAIAWRVLCA